MRTPVIGSGIRHGADGKTHIHAIDIGEFEDCVFMPAGR